MKYDTLDIIRIKSDKNIYDKIRGRTGRIIFSGTKLDCYSVDFGEEYPIVVEGGWILGKENQLELI